MSQNKKAYKGQRAQRTETDHDMQRYVKTVPIKGMHCASCELLIADELESIEGVTSATASLKTKTATITSTRTLANNDIAEAMREAGYEIGLDDGRRPLISSNPRVWKDFFVGLMVIMVLFIVFKVFGLERVFTNATAVGGGNGVMALVVGVTAGFSTCIALIGGLVLGVASKYAEHHPTETPLQKFKPHVFFNLGRIASFIVFGALIGAIGSAFALKGTLLGFLTIIVGVVMLVLGLQLTELFPRITKGFTLPSGIAKVLGIHERKSREYSHKNAFMMGAVTFFLPCGFTQAMQLLAVSTGSPVQAAIIMGAFALGTAPGLLSLGGLTSVVKGAFAQRFFRVVGVVVVAMAMINFGNGFTLANIKPSLPKPAVSTAVPKVDQSTEGSAILNTVYRSRTDIVPSTFTAKVGQKTTLLVDTQDNGYGCMSTIMIIGLNDTPQYLKKGDKIALTFTATKPGNYTIACAMGIPRGSITVTE